MSGAPPPLERKSIEEASREAEARALDFDPKERATLIRKMLNDIPMWMNRGDSEESIRQRIPDFIEQYPELFKKIITRSDLTPIRTMLTMLDKMGQNSISQHQASIVVGQRLVDKYVTPKLQGVGGKNK